MVKPWLATQAKLPLEKGEVLVGHNIVGDMHEHVKFFNQEFIIRGRLAKTGMGFDNTVFVNFEEARRLVKEYEKVLKLEDKDHENMISCVMIKVDNSVDPVEIQNNIRNEFAGQGVYP